MGGFGVLGEDATRCMVENAVGTFPLPLGEPGACENHQTTREISRGYSATARPRKGFAFTLRARVWVLLGRAVAGVATNFMVNGKVSSAQPPKRTAASLCSHQPD